LKTYGFNDVDLIISHPDVGQYQQKGEGLGSIAIVFANDRSAHDVAADGHVVVSKIDAKNGTVTITAQQTSELHNFMKRLYNYLSNAAASRWAETSITVRDRNNGDTTKCSGVSIQKYRDIGYQKESQTAAWQLMAAEIKPM
jgi:hypothetical protein